MADTTDPLSSSSPAMPAIPADEISVGGLGEDSPVATGTESGLSDEVLAGALEVPATTGEDEGEDEDEDEDEDDDEDDEGGGHAGVVVKQPPLSSVSSRNHRLYDLVYALLKEHGGGNPRVTSMVYLHNGSVAEREIELDDGVIRVVTPSVAGFSGTAKEDGATSLARPDEGSDFGTAALVGSKILG